MLDEIEDYVAGKPFKQYCVLIKGSNGWRKSFSQDMMRFQAENLAMTFAKAEVCEVGAADTLLLFLNGSHPGDT